MSADVLVESPARRWGRNINSYVLPLGWLVMLTGMFWAGERSLYHKLFYILLAAPTLVALLLQPRMLKKSWCVILCSSHFCYFVPTPY